MSRRFAAIGGLRRFTSDGGPPPLPKAIQTARQAAGVSVITQFQSGHGWTLLGGTTGNVNDTTANQAIGSQCAWFIGNGNNTVVGMRRTGLTSVDLTGRDVGLLLRVDEPNQIPATGASFLIYLGNGGFANFVTLSLTNDGAYKFFPRRNTSANAFGGSWQYVTIPLDTSTTLPTYMSLSGAQTAAQVLANVTDWQIYHRDPNPSTPTRISVNELFHLPKQSTYTNGVCCMTFDDGWGSCITKAAPYLTANGGRAQLYIIRDAIGTGTYLTQANLQTLQNTHSWSIGCHANYGVDHVYPGFPNITPAAGISDIQQLRTWLRANGYTGYNELAYPNGGYCVDNAGVGTADDSVDVNFAPYVKTARTIYNQMPETIPPADPMKLRTYWATSNVTTLAQMKAFADAAKRMKEAMIVVFHEIVDTGPLTSSQWLTSDFQAFVDYLVSIGMPIRTVDEVYGVL